jgi:hypothetical protein
VEDRWAAQQAERAEEEANRRAQEAAGTKKERIALQRAAAEAKSKRENIGLDRMAPKFPLPPIGDEQEAALMAELQLRQHVSGGAGRAAHAAAFVWGEPSASQMLAGPVGWHGGAAPSPHAGLSAAAAPSDLPTSCRPPPPPAASTLPSCCFFTFFNTHQSLNCVAFTSDAEMVAGGRLPSAACAASLQRCA